MAAGMAGLLARSGGFTVLTEVVPWRGALDDGAGTRARGFAAQLRSVPQVDAVSVTDGAGGRLTLSPESLAAQLADAGQRVLVHVTCRDRNRNELAALGWRLASAGLTDVLALSGDYPHEGYLGVARPVFDLDSVSLLQLYTTLGSGAGGSGADGIGPAIMSRAPVRATPRGPRELLPGAGPDRWPRSASPLYLGAAVNPFQARARDAVPQYLKLERKAAAGARFVITQAGYDARRWHELTRYVADHDLPLHVLPSVYVLSAGSARAFHAGKVPGAGISDDLLAEAERQAAAPDRGRSYFLWLAAAQVAVARGMGLSGVCLSGLSDAADVARVLELAGELGGDRWAELLPQVSWGGPEEFWFYAPDPDTGLTGTAGPGPPRPRRRSLRYAVSRMAHEALFVPGSRRFAAAGRVVEVTRRAGLGRSLHLVEQVIKRPLYGCQDCGDCSLPDIAFLCPESQCVKNQRNGPCGGSRDGECEIPGRDCIWARAYDRMAAGGTATSLLRFPVAVQDNSLRHSSSWANALAGQDLHGRRATAGTGTPAGTPVGPPAGAPAGTSTGFPVLATDPRPAPDPATGSVPDVAPAPIPGSADALARVSGS